MVEILIELAKLSPIIGILIVALIYFIKNEKGYKAEIKEFNKMIRESEKENLIMINKLADAIDNIAKQGGSIHNDIMLLKEIIKIKLDELKNNLK